MMEFGAIIKIVLGFINLANTLFSWLHDRKMIHEGERLAVEKAAAALQERAKRAREIEEEVGKLSDEDVRKKLEKEGDFRD